MRYYNTDGNESTMCGNGGRCIAMFTHHLGICGDKLSFNSSDGLHSTEIISANGTGGIVRMDMADVKGIENFTNDLFIDTESPHYVRFVNEIDLVDVSATGASIRNSEYFASSRRNQR